MTPSPPKSFHGAANIFRTRLSDREVPDPLRLGPGCVQVAIGARDRTSCRRFSKHFLSLSPTLVTLAPSSSRQAMTSWAVGNSPRTSLRGTSTAPPRPTAWRSEPPQADRDDYDPQRRPRRHVRGGAYSRGPGARGPRRPSPPRRYGTLQRRRPGPVASKMTVACEPPVSVLTEVAKLLQPGRCVT